MSQTSLNFYRNNQVFRCWARLDRIFFLAEVLFFHKPWLSNFFLTGFLFYRKPTWFSKRGSEWHRQQIHGRETGNWARESNLGPTKRSCCKVRGSNPGPSKTSCLQGTRKNTQIAHEKYTLRAQHPRGTHPLDDGPRPDHSNFLNFLKILRFSRIIRKDVMHLSVRSFVPTNLGHNQDQDLQVCTWENIPQKWFIMGDTW